jgi:hypothetical protein
MNNRHAQERITATLWTRRRFVACAAAFSASSLLVAAKNEVTPAVAFDKVVEDFMKERGTAGGALAVVKDRRLAYARGYGWADRDAKIAVKADSLFRIASASKPITGVAVLKLAEHYEDHFRFVAWCSRCAHHVCSDLFTIGRTVGWVIHR